MDKEINNLKADNEVMQTEIASLKEQVAMLMNAKKDSPLELSYPASRQNSKVVSDIVAKGGGGIYAGTYTNTGGFDLGMPNMPFGWYYTEPSVGVVIIYHNLGSSNYAVVATPNYTSANSNVMVDGISDVSFTVHSYVGSTLTGNDFSFILKLKL